jgi:outer membrane murein-binding lipoprotein Lpp
MAGTAPCRTCGQVNGPDSEFCVRCGEKLPDPQSTQVVSNPGVTPPAEYPWEPPAEWDPGELPPATGPQQTWVGRNPDQAAWNTAPPVSATPPGAYQGGYPTAPPTPAPAGSGGSKKPLLIGGGAVVVIAIIVAVILLAGGGSKKKSTSIALNGVQTQTGTEALTSARVALRNATTARLTGNITTGGQKIQLDLELVGDNATGTLTVNNNDVQLIKLNGVVYIKGDPDFLAQYDNGNAAAVKALNGKWLKTASTSDFDSFSINGFADQLKASKNVTVNAKTMQATAGGKPVVILTQSDGSSLSIANTGEPYPLTLIGKGADAGMLTFSDFNKPVTITAPTDVFDVSASATPTPSASPTTDSVHADLVGGYKCTIDGSANGGGTINLDANTTYSVPNGVGGTWQSNGDAVSFTGGYLDGYAGTYDGNNTVHLRGAGTNASVALTCVFT